MSDLKHKSIRVSESGMKVVGDPSEGIVEMVVSVFGNKDSYNERMMPGCYVKSLNERVPTGLFMHNWEKPVAKTLEAKELHPHDPLLPEAIKANGGLYIKAQYNLDTQRGKDAFSDIQKGIINEFSVGYKEVDATWNKELGCSDVTEAFLFEWSSVVAGANPSTAVISAKSVDFDHTNLTFRDGTQFKTALDALCELGERVKSELSVIGKLRAKDRNKEGRQFSTGHTTQLSTHVADLHTLGDRCHAMAKDVEGMLAAAQPKPENPNGEHINQSSLDFASLRTRALLNSTQHV